MQHTSQKTGKFLVRYTENNQQYYMVHRRDFGWYFVTEEQLEKNRHGGLSTFPSATYAMNVILIGMSHNDSFMEENVGLPETDGIKKMRTIYHTLPIDDIENQIVPPRHDQYDYKKELTVDDDTKGKLNEMMENFSLIDLKSSQPENKLVI